MEKLSWQQKLKTTPEQEEETKTELVAVDLPVDFSKQDLDRVTEKTY